MKVYALLRAVVLLAVEALLVVVLFAVVLLVVEALLVVAFLAAIFILLFVILLRVNLYLNFVTADGENKFSRREK